MSSLSVELPHTYLAAPTSPSSRLSLVHRSFLPSLAHWAGSNDEATPTPSAAGTPRGPRSSGQLPLSAVPGTPGTPHGVPLNELLLAAARAAGPNTPLHHRSVRKSASTLSMGLDSNGCVIDLHAGGPMSPEPSGSFTGRGGQPPPLLQHQASQLSTSRTVRGVRSSDTGNPDGTVGGGGRRHSDHHVAKSSAHHFTICKFLQPTPPQSPAAARRLSAAQNVEEAKRVLEEFASGNAPEVLSRANLLNKLEALMHPALAAVASSSLSPSGLHRTISGEHSGFSLPLPLAQPMLPRPLLGTLSGSLASSLQEVQQQQQLQQQQQAQQQQHDKPSSRRPSLEKAVHSASDNALLSEATPAAASPTRHKQAGPHAAHRAEDAAQQQKLTSPAVSSPAVSNTFAFGSRTPRIQVGTTLQSPGMNGPRGSRNGRDDSGSDQTAGRPGTRDGRDDLPTRPLPLGSPSPVGVSLLSLSPTGGGGAGGNALLNGLLPIKAMGSPRFAHVMEDLAGALGGRRHHSLTSLASSDFSDHSDSEATSPRARGGAADSECFAPRRITHNSGGGGAGSGSDLSPRNSLSGGKQPPALTPRTRALRPAGGLAHSLRQRAGAGPGTEALELQDEFSLVEAAARRRDLFVIPVHAAPHTHDLMLSVMEQNPAAFSEEVAAHQELDLQREVSLAHKLMAVDGDQRAHEAALAQVQIMQAQRPFFHNPRSRKEQLDRCTEVFTTPAEDAALLRAVNSASSSALGGASASALPAFVFAEEVEEQPWILAASLFQDRALRTDARDIFDSERVLEQQFNIDWGRIIIKGNFRKLFQRSDNGKGGKFTPEEAAEHVQHELARVRSALHEHRHIIRRTFQYYSLHLRRFELIDVMEMTRQLWKTFAAECGLMVLTGPGAVRGSLLQDMDSIFTSTDFDEVADADAAEAVGDTHENASLLRFKFMEILVRAALCRYVTTRLMSDPVEAIHTLMNNVVIPGLCNDAMVDPNAFRKHRFYVDAMEREIDSRWDVLNATFRLYKAKDKTRYFTICHWCQLLIAMDLFERHTGLAKVDLKTAFVWSQLCVIDELKNRSRATSLHLWDFVEGLARLCESLSLPSADEVPLALQALDQAEAPMDVEPGEAMWQYMHRCSEAGKPLLRRTSGSGLPDAPTSRPLAEKFHDFVDFLVVALRKIYGGDNEAQLVTRMDKMTTLLSGGIERS